MRIRRLIPFALSCLLILETPLISQAASVPSAGSMAENLSVLAENRSMPADTPSGKPEQLSSRTENIPSRQADDTPSGKPEQLSSQTENIPSRQADDTRSGKPEQPSSQTENIPSRQAENIPSRQEETEDSSIQLSHSAETLVADETLQLTADVYDHGNIKTDTIVTWASNSSEIASVSEEGLVTAHKPGEAVITASAVLDTENGIFTLQADCIITVADRISLNKDKLTLYTTQTAQLKATTESGDAVTWQSSDTDIVSVNAKGLLKPLKKGTATVTASANGASASCKVTVKAPTLKLASAKTIYLHNPQTLKATVSPKGSVSWKSSDTKIATVSKKGKVTPQKTGTVTITASCHGLKKSCKVTVKKPSVKLTSKKITIFAENDYTMTVSARPSGKLSYRTSNPKVAKVSKNGVITGIHQGTATITASVPGAKASCKVTVLKNNHKLNRTSVTLMKGSSTNLYMSNIPLYGSVSFSAADSSIAQVTYNEGVCKVKALHSGKTTVDAYYSVYQDGQYVSCKRTCKIKVISSGIKQQQSAVAVGSNKTLSLKNVDKSGTDITNTVWTSSNPKIASINQAGKVKGKKSGTVKITAAVHYSDGTSKNYLTQFKVSAPKTKYKRTTVPIGGSQKVALSGLTSYSNVTWKLKNKSLVSISPDGTITAGYKAGKATLTIKADGKTIKHTIAVTNPKLKSDYAVLAPGQTAQIELSGVSPQSKITYKSKRTSVATVNSSGAITAHGYGNASISVTADGMKFTFQVDVAPQRAIDACKTGYGIMYSSTYSQAQRMTTGFYDCSSLVFRSYGCDAGLLGGTRSWAPTAASMASYLEGKGKVISYSGLSSAQLRPGDLIFYSAPYNNGRYRNIYHVSMYYGGGYRLEKPLRSYYPADGSLVMIARPVN